MISRETTYSPILPSLPTSWSTLTWHQLCKCWTVKMLYGGNADIARAAALLALCNLTVQHENAPTYNRQTSEREFTLRGADRRVWIITPRNLAYLATQGMRWFDYPYGDLGEKEERDKQGNITKEQREAVPGYVNPNFRDAMELPLPEIKHKGTTFALPQLACNNLTWQQYRSLQAIVPQLFDESNTEVQTLALQAQFLAHILVPEQPLPQSVDRFRPAHQFRYDVERAEQSVKLWVDQLTLDNRKTQKTHIIRAEQSDVSASVLFHICFQVYQTSMHYYEVVYPLLFQNSGKNDPLRDALTGEVGTVNTIMKYTGYASQQEVYDSNLPFILDILNTMTKEAKEIEKMNSKIKKK